MSQRILATILLLTLTVTTLAPLQAVQAEGAFNPDFILSDEELQAQSMDRADIQAFLEEYESSLATLKTEDKDGVTRTAADIIFRAAQEHEINPKYILVKLQKEQSLITTENPTQKQLDGAAGYGISDGCGWSCDVYLRNKGFGKQVDAAAGIMRWYYDNVETQGFIKRPNQQYTINGERVTPLNYATAFLYTYTPHILGNKNFWLIWERWFEQVYPDGTLVTTPDDNTVYLIQEGVRRKIANMSALVTRFDPKLIITIPESELSRYDIGATISFPNYAILEEGGDYYLLDYDTLRPFESEAVFREYGYNPGEVIEVTRTDIRDYKIGEPLRSPGEDPRGYILEAVETGGLYFIKDNTYTPILDEKIATLSLTGVRKKQDSISILADLEEQEPLLFPNGTIIGVRGSNRIYVVEYGKKRHIKNEQVFEGLGYDWGNIVWTNQLMGIAHRTGSPVFLRTAPAQAVAGTKTTPPPQPATPDPTDDPTNLMVRAEETETTGPVFNTAVDTYLIADAETGKVLAGKNIDLPRPLASLTKVITAYQLAQSNINTKQIVEYNAARHKSLYHRFRITNGEMVRNRDLLDSFLVSSLNTPGKMLVQSLMDESVFLQQAEETAHTLGGTTISLADVSGVEVANEASATDYAQFFLAAIKDPLVAEYLEKRSYQYDEVLDLDDAPGHFDSHSNKLISQGIAGATIGASKTGFLYEAGGNLAMIVERNSDGKQFLILTMGNPNFSDRFTAPQAITEWALKTF